MFSRLRKISSVYIIISLLIAGLVSTCFAVSERTTLALKSPPVSASVPAWGLYNQFCFGCHGMSKQGKPAIFIQNAINSVASMVSLKSLAVGQIAAIAAGR